MASVLAKEGEWNVQRSRSPEEASAFLWPQVCELGWVRITYVPVEELQSRLNFTVFQNRGEPDMDMHYHVARGNVFLLRRGANPKPVGAIVPTVFDNKTAWVSFFILDAAHRGHGGGRLIFQALGDFFKVHGVQHVGLDAVEAQIKTYERRGFVQSGAINILIHGPLTRASLPALQEANSSVMLAKDEKIIPLADLDREQLTRSDLAHTGFERPRTWSNEHMFSRPDAWGFAVVGPSSQLRSWLLVRCTLLGYRIGPVYAASADHARILLRAAMIEVAKGGKVGGESGRLDVEVWSKNGEARAVFEEMGWKWSGVNYNRMWLDGNIPEPQKRGGLGDRETFAIFDAAQG